MTRKILLLDIETVPSKAYVWRYYKEYVSPAHVIEPERVICWAAKWFGEKGILFSSEWGMGRKDMLGWIFNLLGDADAVVTYNGDKFDLPKLMGEFAREDMGSPGPLTSIDLYKTAKKLGYPSGKLEFVAPAMGVGNKEKNSGFQMWLDVMNGKHSAQKDMEKYNKQDTLLLEKLYKKMRPFINNHPYLGTGRPNECPACGGKKLHSRGVRRTKSFIIERYRCQSCGHWPTGPRHKVT